MGVVQLCLPWHNKWWNTGMRKQEKYLKHWCDGKIHIRNLKIISQSKNSEYHAGKWCAWEKKVMLDSLQMPHLIWGKNQEEYLSHLSSLPNVTEDVEHYFVTGFYYTSEREPHVQIDRSLAYSQMAWEILLPKGYKMLNAFDVTAAFSFDTAGQFDGLHILGPPIQTIVTKLFHHLCLK